MPALPEIDSAVTDLQKIVRPTVNVIRSNGGTVGAAAFLSVLFSLPPPSAPPPS
ncbi:hypothetical protein [Streptomyces sp. NPDC059092]|uniref:hypothetical protein n=1 Tax=Streptomyces sp. NPDC059092 TaxID=3346725 RepID=UPI0036985B5B